MSKLRFRISMSVDGFIAGPNQSVDHPLGMGGERLHEWVIPLKVRWTIHELEGGEVNESTAVVEKSLRNIGASIMARNMFGGHPGPWDPKNETSPYFESLYVNKAVLVKETPGVWRNIFTTIIAVARPTADMGKSSPFKSETKLPQMIGALEDQMNTLRTKGRETMNARAPWIQETALAWLSSKPKRQTSK